MKIVRRKLSAGNDVSKMGTFDFPADKILLCNKQANHPCLVKLLKKRKMLKNSSDDHHKFLVLGGKNDQYLGTLQSAQI